MKQKEKQMNKGWIKVSAEMWQIRRARRLIKSIMTVEHKNLDPLSGAYIIAGHGKYFTIERKEGSVLPQYDIAITTHLKRWLWFKHDKWTFKVETI